LGIIFYSEKIVFSRAHVTRARIPWEICFFAFTTFTEGEKKDGKRGRKEGTPAVAMLDKNGVKILDNIAIVKNCPKSLR